MAQTVGLTHPFLCRCKDFEKLLQCDKFNTYCSKVDRQARVEYNINELSLAADLAMKSGPKAIADALAELDMQKFAIELARTKALDKFNKYKGDAFEIFVEMMIRFFSGDKRLGLIQDYKVVADRDVGVDGYGICAVDQKPFTVQCKYRQYDYCLKANEDHLTNFTSASLLHYGVEIPEDVSVKLNCVIITSGKGLHHFTDEHMFGHRVHVFARQDIKNLVDNNPAFWESFRESWKQSYNELKGIA